MKALKKSLALAGEKGAIRGSTAAVEQARPPASSEATQEAAGSSRQAVTPQVIQKVESSGTAQAPVSEATTASRGVTRCATGLEVCCKASLCRLAVLEMYVLSPPLNIGNPLYSVVLQNWADLWKQ